MIMGHKGYPVRYECSDLIAELKTDIAEFGKDKLLAVWLRNYPGHGVEVAVNYDYVVDGKPISNAELLENERFAIMTAESLLDLLQKQNDEEQIYT